MDGLSAAASIIAVLQLTGEVIGYLNDVNDAPKECQQCTIEASNVQNLLINLRYRLEQAQPEQPWFTAVRALNTENGPLDQYKHALEQLLARVEIQDSVQKLKRRLLWKFRKEEVASILVRIERLKSLVNIALEMDHFKLSQAIKEDLKILQDADQAIKADTKFLRDALPNLQTDILTIRDTQHLQQDEQRLQQLQIILDWVSPTDFPAQQHDIISRRQEGTGQWLLDSPKFKGWLQGAHRTLICPGIPGSGKTMMAAIAIDHLSTLSQADIGLAYVFCNYKSQVDQNLYGLLSALLKQLVQSRRDMLVTVTRLYDQHSKKKSRPSLDEIFAALLDVCLNHARVYVIVDALDEYTDQDRTREQLIEKLRQLQMRTNTQLLFTSRFIPEIEEKFRLDSVLEVRASEEDVEKFVAGQIPRLPKCIRRDEELRRAVQSGIVKAIDGMFLLARLYVDSLLDKRTKQEVLSTLEKLGKGTAALDKAYGHAIERIDGQLAGDRSLARRTISWISWAQRPLTAQELCHALAIGPGDRCLNRDNFYDVEDIISVCAGLVIVDKESNIVRLVHYTTQEYFEQIRLDWNPGAVEEIASACLTYLAFDTFRSGSCHNDKDFEKRVGQNVFLDYAARHWAEHVRPIEAKVSELALAFLQDNALVLCCTQVVSVKGYKYRGHSQQFPRSTTGLHLLVRFGLVFLSRILLTVDCKGYSINVDAKDAYGKTPLCWAAEKGYPATVQLLIEKGAEIESKNQYGRTPLSWAAEGGHTATVQLLLEKGAKIKSKDQYGWTPLLWAAGNGNVATVQLLLEEGAEIESKNQYSQTPLSRAAGNGHTATVQLLLEKGAEIKSKDKFGRTPLLRAAQNGHTATVQLLLQKGAEIESKDQDGRTSLSQAAGNGHTVTVQLLLQKGAEIESKDQSGQTPLLWAAREGHEAIVELLLGSPKRSN